MYTKTKFSKQAMHTTAETNFKPYSPQLSAEAVFILRRLAWAAGTPMTKTLDALVFQAAESVGGPEICAGCKSGLEQCLGCRFRHPSGQPE